MLPGPASPGPGTSTNLLSSCASAWLIQDMVQAGEGGIPFGLFKTKSTKLLIRKRENKKEIRMLGGQSREVSRPLVRPMRHLG